MTDNSATGTTGAVFIVTRTGKTLHAPGCEVLDGLTGLAEINEVQARRLIADGTHRPCGDCSPPLPAPPPVTGPLSWCYARESQVTQHYGNATSGKTLCGLNRGEQVPGGTPVNRECASCRRTARRLLIAPPPVDLTPDPPKQEPPHGPAPVAEAPQLNGKPLAACYAKHRPAKNAAIHYVIPGDERALCGVQTGEAVADTSRAKCWTCRETLREAAEPKPAAPAPAEAELAAAIDAVFDGPPLVLIEVCDRHAHVYLSWNPLLVGIIRRMPGAKWHKDAKQWTIPAAFADELAQRLRNAGAQVTTEIQP